MRLLQPFQLVSSLLLAAASLSYAATSSSGAGISLPTPPGPWKVGITAVEFTDPSRVDPFAPSATPRSLMLHVRYPIATSAGLKQSPYLQPNAAATAEGLYQLPAGIISTITTHAFLSGHLSHALTTADGSVPILLFSPGSGSPEALYSVIQNAMASYGYITVGIDHTYDSSLVQFPDGTVINAAPAAATNLTAAAAVRADDVVSVAHHITKPGVLASWIRGFSAASSYAGHLRQAYGGPAVKLGIFGHSLGGTTANLAMQHPGGPFVGGASLDGPVFGVRRLNETGFRGPFFFGGARLDTTNYALLAGVWRKIQPGFKLAVGWKNTAHDDMSDLSVLVPQAPGSGLAAAYAGLLSNPTPVRLQNEIATYLKAFWDFVLRGQKEGETLKHPSAAYPDVVFENPS